MYINVHECCLSMCMNWMYTCEKCSGLCPRKVWTFPGWRSWREWQPCWFARTTRKSTEKKTGRIIMKQEKDINFTLLKIHARLTVQIDMKRLLRFTCIVNFNLVFRLLKSNHDHARSIQAIHVMLWYWQGYFAWKWYWKL